MTFLFKYIILSTLFLQNSGLSKIDSLENRLSLAETDTAKISILIDLAYGSDSLENQLSYSKEAFLLGQQNQSIRHKSRSELVYGVFLAEVNLDSGMILMNRGAKRYGENEMNKYATNAYYIIGLTFESASKFDLALEAYRKAYNYGKKEDNLPELGLAASSLANINNIRGNNVEALKWALEAKEIYEKAESTDYLSDALNQIGIIYDQKGLYAEALENYLQARDLAISSNNVYAEILINNNIGVIYDNMNNSEMALQYYSDALEKARIHTIEDSEATLLNNISYIHLRQGDTIKAEQLLKQSLSVDLSKIFPCFESYPLEGLGSIYINKGLLDSAELLLNKALETGEACEDAAVNTAIYKDLGQLYQKQGKLKAAKEALMKSLKISQDANLIVDKKNALKELSNFYQEAGNLDLAVKYLSAYTALSDSITEVNSVEKAAELAAQYEFRKQVSKLEQERIESENALNDKIQAQSKENRLILLALVLFALLAISLARSFFYIRKKNERLKWLDNEKNKLMGMVAHDLRNPLNMIIGLIPLFEDLASKEKNKELDQYTELLNISSERMRSMIDRTLDLSEIENMKVNLKKEKTDLSKLTNSTASNFRMIAAKKDIKIESDIEESHELFANVDPNYLIQVVENLLTNAIKFSNEGSVVKVSISSSNGQHTISVSDQGPGISSEDQKNLFQAYTKLSSKPTGQERSSGLGLSIAQKFVESMDGTINCDSTLGKGTTFSVSFKSA